MGAREVADELLASGEFERGGMRIKAGPTVAETAEEHSY
jgi:hypothetical protein